jgi:hypothetical protein
MASGVKGGKSAAAAGKHGVRQENPLNALNTAMATMKTNRLMAIIGTSHDDGYSPQMTKPDFLKNRRAFTLGLTAAILNGCGNTGQPGISTVVEKARDIFRDANFTRADVERIPYASIGVRVGGGPESLVVLASVDGDKYTWIAADHSLLITRGGRITRLIGMGSDIRDQAGVGSDPVAEAGLRLISQTAPCLRTVDFAKEQQYGITLKSEITANGPAMVDMLYAPLPAQHFIENGRFGAGRSKTRFLWMRKPVPSGKAASRLPPGYRISPSAFYVRQLKARPPPPAFSR